MFSPYDNKFQDQLRRWWGKITSGSASSLMSDIFYWSQKPIGLRRQRGRPRRRWTDLSWVIRFSRCAIIHSPVFLTGSVVFCCGCAGSIWQFPPLLWPPPDPSKPFILISIGSTWVWKNVWGYGRKVHAKIWPWGMPWDPSYDHFRSHVASQRENPCWWSFPNLPVWPSPGVNLGVLLLN